MTLQVLLLQVTLIFVWLNLCSFLGDDFFLFCGDRYNEVVFLNLNCPPAKMTCVVNVSSVPPICSGGISRMEPWSPYLLFDHEYSPCIPNEHLFFKKKLRQSK